MPLALFALAMINFAVGTQNFAFAGVLPEIARDLGVTIGAAGLLVAGSSIAFAIGAPLAAGLVATIERRSVILVGLMALGMINGLCALAPSYGTLVGLRIAAGIATAFVGALATVAAAALVPPEKRGRAFAIVMGGLTVAFVLGVPIGSVVGGAFGWRATFLFSAVVSLLSLLLILLAVPRIEPTPGQRLRIADLAGNGAVLRTLALTLIGFSATFTVVAFIGPVITAATGATGAGVGALQVFIGVGSIFGLVSGGIVADRGGARRGAVLAFAIMAVSLAAYWLVLSASPGSVSFPILGLLILVGAAALFSLIPITLADLAATAGAAAPIALALNGSLMSLGQGIGALWGGWLTDTFGPAVMGPGGAFLALIGLGLAMKRESGSVDSAASTLPVSAQDRVG